jgi:hypothetical protein
MGRSVKCPPCLFPAARRFVEDLKRTDFIAVEELEERDVLSQDYLDHFAAFSVASRSLMTSTTRRPLFLVSELDRQTRLACVRSHKLMSEIPDYFFAVPEQLRGVVIVGVNGNPLSPLN